MIEARNICFSYKTGLRRRIKALDDFSISVGEGDIFGLLGPNGSGKSTAMYCFLGLIKPDSGTVKITGKDVEAGSGLFREVSFLPEEPDYHQYLTVEEAVRYYAALYNLNIPPGRGEELMKRFGLWKFRNIRVSQCSKGMKQKVGIVQAFLNEKSSLLFLDEPTRGLDPVAAKDLRDCLLEINGKGATVVLNSHMLSEVETVCNRIAIMDRGRVVVQDELSRLMVIDREVYEVVTDSTENYPDYIKEPVLTPSLLKGLVEPSRLNEFLAYAGRNNLKIFQCSLKKLSLEEIFSRFVNSGNRNEGTAQS